MKQDDFCRKRARSVQVYTWVLRLYPKVHQRTFGQPMLQTFQDHYRDAIETEGESEWHFWLTVIGDEGQSLVREHVAALRERILLMKKIFLVPVVIGVVVLFTLLNMAFHIIRPLMELYEPRDA